MGRKLSRCLNSQEISDRIEDGTIVTSEIGIDKRIQPASFEPIIGDELFVLEPETAGLFRPNTEETVYRSLLKLPKRQRQRQKTDGFEIKRGFSYLIPLEEKITLSEGEYVKSSPKSSTGRVFVNVRLLTDFNPGFDEIRQAYGGTRRLSSWILVQPLAFNAIIQQGLTLNQLRFFNGLDSMLTPNEIVAEIEKRNIVYKRNQEGKLEPIRPIVTQEGIQVHLDLTGEHTEGIVALRARHNPNPIELAKVKQYEAEDFFEPLTAKGGRVEIKAAEHYLFASSEVIDIPNYLSAELMRTHHAGLRGDIHFAGFIDPGFNGDVVFEIKSSEHGNVTLPTRNIPVSAVQLFRNKPPEKVYGDKKLGSNYQGQLGTKPAKNFKAFDFTLAARNYDKLSRNVLTQDSQILLRHRRQREGFEFLNENCKEELIRAVHDGFFHSRYDCETDEDVLQPIPYILIFDENRNVFSYVRSENIEDFGEERLFGKHSIGTGGHIIQLDAPNYLDRGLEREMDEEVYIVGRKGVPKLCGTLMAFDKSVDRVHFGLVYSVHCKSVRQKEKSVISGRMISLDKIMFDEDRDKKYETWSRLLIPHLKTLAEM